MKKIISIALTVSFICSLSTCGNTTDPPSASVSPTASATHTPSPTPKAVFAIGNTATLGDWSITVSSMEFATQIIVTMASLSLVQMKATSF